MHGPCSACNSSDACWSFPDGKGTYCFSCQVYQHTDGGAEEPVDRDLDLCYADLTKRSIPESVCRLYGYRVGTHKGRPCHAAPVRKGGELTGWKLRYADKTFTVLGDAKGCDLWGQHLFEPGHRPLVITEGEIDAMSVWEGSQWPAVSLPQGAGSAVQSFKRHKAWIESFDEVILWFDGDAPGQQALHDAVLQIDLNKAKVTTL